FRQLRHSLGRDIRKFVCPAHEFSQHLAEPLDPSPKIADEREIVRRHGECRRAVEESPQLARQAAEVFEALQRKRVFRAATTDPSPDYPHVVNPTPLALSGPLFWLLSGLSPKHPDRGARRDWLH